MIFTNRDNFVLPEIFDKIKEKYNPTVLNRKYGSRKPCCRWLFETYLKLSLNYNLNTFLQENKNKTHILNTAK